MGKSPQQRRNRGTSRVQKGLSERILAREEQEDRDDPAADGEEVGKGFTFGRVKTFLSSGVVLQVFRYPQPRLIASVRKDQGGFGTTTYNLRLFLDRE